MPSVRLNADMQRRRFTLRPLHAWLLALLLLAAQAAGLSHRVVHAPGLAPAHTAWADGHEQGQDDCRLVDQLAHADALCGAAQAPLALLPLAAAATPLRPQARPAGKAAAYLARGPPPATLRT